MFCYVNVGRHIIASRQAPKVTQANYRQSVSFQLVLKLISEIQFNDIHRCQVGEMVCLTSEAAARWPQSLDYKEAEFPPRLRSEVRIPPSPNLFFFADGDIRFDLKFENLSK